MLIYELESFVLCHHPEKPCDHKECKSVDIIFLICHVNFFVSTYLKGYKKLRWKVLTESHYLVMIRGLCSSASVYIKYLKCHVTSQNPVIEG